MITATNLAHLHIDKTTPIALTNFLLFGHVDYFEITHGLLREGSKNKTKKNSYQRIFGWKMICQCGQSSFLAWFKDASLIQSQVTSSNSSSSSSSSFALSSFFIRTKYQLIILLICQKSPKIRFWPKSQRHWHQQFNPMFSFVCAFDICIK